MCCFVLDCIYRLAYDAWIGTEKAKSVASDPEIETSSARS